MPSPRMLAVGLAATLFGAVACVPNDSESMPPLGSGGTKGTGGSGSGGRIVTGGTGGNSGSGGSDITGGTGGSDGSGGTVGTGGSNGEGGKGGSGDVGGKGGDSGRGGGAAGSGNGGTGGSAGGSGGRGGAGTGGGGGGPTGGAGCPAGALLCEGFEAYTAGAPPEGGWTREGGPYEGNNPGKGVTNVDTTRASSGQKSLHVTGKLTGVQSSIRRPLEIESPTVFVRLMMYTVAYPGQGVHTRLARLGTDVNNTYSLATYNGVAIEKINSLYLRDTGTRPEALTNKWLCWEFSIDKTGGKGKVVPKIWLDGKELSLVQMYSSHGGTTNSWDPVDFKVFWLGLFGYQASEDVSYWLDDVVVHTQRIGCPAK